MRFLIVDDSALARRLVRRTLEDNAEGRTFDIIEASNGEEAKHRLQEKSVDLVIVDWNMPVLDGLSFVKDLRAQGLVLPVVMISAVSEEESIHEAVLAGVTDYIEKPIQGQELWNRIKRHVK